MMPELVDGVQMYSVFDGHGEGGGLVTQWAIQNLPAYVAQAVTSGRAGELLNRVTDAYRLADDQLETDLSYRTIEDSGTTVNMLAAFVDGGYSMCKRHQAHLRLAASLSRMRCQAARDRLSPDKRLSGNGSPRGVGKRAVEVCARAMPYMRGGPMIGWRRWQQRFSKGTSFSSPASATLEWC